MCCATKLHLLPTTPCRNDTQAVVTLTDEAHHNARCEVARCKVYASPATHTAAGPPLRSTGSSSACPVCIVTQWKPLEPALVRCYRERVWPKSVARERIKPHHSPLGRESKRRSPCMRCMNMHPHVPSKTGSCASSFGVLVLSTLVLRTLVGWSVQLNGRLRYSTGLWCACLLVGCGAGT